MQFNDFLSAALGIVSIATLAGLGFMRGTVTNLREQLADSRNQIKDLKESRIESDAKTATLQADLAALGRLKTGEEEWAKVDGRLEGLGQMVGNFAVKLDDHHDQAMHRLDQGAETLTEIRDELRRRGTP